MHLSYTFGCSLHQVIEMVNKCRIQDSNIKQFVSYGPASTLVVFQGSRDDIKWIQENIIGPYISRTLVTAVRDDQENQSELVLEGYMVFSWDDKERTKRRYLRTIRPESACFESEFKLYKDHPNQYHIEPVYSVKVPETEL